MCVYAPLYIQARLFVWLTKLLLSWTFSCWRNAALVLGCLGATSLVMLWTLACCTQLCWLAAAGWLLLEHLRYLQYGAAPSSILTPVWMRQVRHSFGFTRMEV